MGVEDRHASAFEQRHDESDGVAKVVERRRVRNFPAKQEALVRLGNDFREGGARAPQLSADPLVAKPHPDTVGSDARV